MTEKRVGLPPGYRWQGATSGDAPRIRWWLQATLQEAFPQQTNWEHLQDTIDRLYDPPRTPCWWVFPQDSSSAVGCVWAGTSVDQVTNLRVAYVFLLRVDPQHRRQGLGRALIRKVETWAEQEALAGVLLQVFAHNRVAMDLYFKEGFTTQGHWLHKALSSSHLRM